jgi:hypothetical protein
MEGVLLSEEYLVKYFNGIEKLLPHIKNVIRSNTKAKGVTELRKFYQCLKKIQFLINEH